MTHALERVGDEPLVVDMHGGVEGAQHRHQRLERSPELGAARSQELLRGEERAQHRPDVAGGGGEGRGDLVDELGGRAVRDEATAQLAADEAGRRGVRRQDVEHLQTVLDAATGRDAVPEHDLLAVVVDLAVEDHLAAPALLERPTGEAARHLVDVLLGVPAVDAQRVQLHDLAGVVLVGLVLVAAGVVEVDEHGGAARGREQQVTEAPQRMPPDDLAVLDHLLRDQVGQRHVEVVGPELDHLLEQLPFAGDGPVDAAPHDLPVDGVVVGVERPADAVHVVQQNRMLREEGVDPRVGDGCMVEVPVYVPGRTEVAHAREVGWSCSPCESVDEMQLRADGREGGVEHHPMMRPE